MEIKKFTYLLNHPEKVEPSDVISLEAILHKYPFFQSARALQLKGLKNQGSYRYNNALKVAAAHTTDRDILFQYITSDDFVQNEISQSIVETGKDFMEFDVIAEDISEEVKDEQQFQKEKEKAEAILNPDLFKRKQLEAEETPSIISRENSSVSDQPEAISPTPFEFTKEDKFSFSEWLKLSKAQPIKRNEKKTEEENAASEVKTRQSELIERFIQERPKITPEPSGGSEVVIQKFLSADTPKDSLMTETLAKVYLQQKNYKKAIQAYKILILKNPEKSGFFADQIRAIEKLINPEHP